MSTPKISDREAGWDVLSTSFHQAPWPDYYAALGRFIQMFGRVEAELHKVLKALVFDLTNTDANGFHWEILEAITGPMRVAGIKDGIKRILRVAYVDKLYCDEFDYAFNQLSEIHFIRDRIAHHGVHESSQTE